ncbi:MAG: ORF6N domain-containing protein [Coriobacteriia bacterium]|nr:ORF6N domain-containing protein [Coriobacteriia bacterium]
MVEEIIKHPSVAIKDMILTVRGVQVLLDSDVAMLYGYETKYINRAASRNSERFPPEFRFQLTADEVDAILRSQSVTSKNVASECHHLKSQIVTSRLEQRGDRIFQPSEEVLRFQSGTSKHEAVLRSQIATSKLEQRGGRRYCPYVYTEHGVIMLAGLLRSETAVQVSIGITNAFVEMRMLLSANKDVFAKLVSIDNKLEGKISEYDSKFDEVFDLLQQPEAIKQSIFFKGQFYDAYQLIVELIKEAEESIVLIDNYIDDSVLDMLASMRKGVSVTVITSRPKGFTTQRLGRFESQYGVVRLVESKDFHDRFMALDGKTVYLIGASLKDAGKKCFGIARIEDASAFLDSISSIIP